MRWVDGQWWISPGPAAAAAPLAWPGIAEAAQVGYRAVTDAQRVRRRGDQRVPRRRHRHDHARDLGGRGRAAARRVPTRRRHAPPLDFVSVDSDDRRDSTAPIGTASPIATVWPVLRWLSLVIALGLFFVQLASTMLRGGRGLVAAGHRPAGVRGRDRR